jgi:tight adherence protein B
VLALPSPIVTYASHLLLAGACATLAYACRKRVVRYFRGMMRGERAAEGRDLLAFGFAAGAIVATALTLLGLPLWAGGVFGGVTAFVLPPLVKGYRRRKYLRDFDGALAESLQTVASSLKAGLTLKDSLYVAADNCPPAFADEVTRALKEYHFGVPIEEALDKLRRRVGTPNCSIAFGSMIISSRLGGRLPEMLKQIVRTIRERQRVEGKLQALTAQGRAQAFLLCSAPPVLGIGMHLYDPAKTALLTDYWVGQILLSLAIVLEVVGIFVTSRILRLEV